MSKKRSTIKTRPKTIAKRQKDSGRKGRANESITKGTKRLNDGGRMRRQTAHGTGGRLNGSDSQKSNAKIKSERTSGRSRSSKSKSRHRKKNTLRIPIDAESQLLRWQKYEELKMNQKAKRGIQSNLSPMPNRHERKKLKRKGINVGEWMEDVQDIPPMNNSFDDNHVKELRKSTELQHKTSIKSRAKFLLDMLKEEQKTKR